MQEEVEQKTVALVISAGKLTGRELKKAMLKLLAHLKDKKAHPNIPQDVYKRQYYLFYYYSLQIVCIIYFFTLQIVCMPYLFFNSFTIVFISEH